MNIKELVEASNGKLESREVEKNGKTLLGVFVRNEGSIASAIIYEDGVEQLTAGETSVEKAVEKVVEYLSEQNKSEQTKYCSDFAKDILDNSEKLLDNLQIRVISVANCGTKTPVKVVGDLAFFYQVIFNFADGAASIIPNDRIETLKTDLGLTDEQVFERAVENTEKSMTIQRFMGEMIFVTNERGFYGASALFVSGAARLKVFEETGGDEYYIIPSSVHEVIIVPTSLGKTADEIKEMHKMVLPTTAENERLSEKIFFVDNEGNLAEC